MKANLNIYNKPTVIINPPKNNHHPHPYYDNLLTLSTSSKPVDTNVKVTLIAQKNGLTLAPKGTKLDSPISPKPSIFSNREGKDKDDQLKIVRSHNKDLNEKKSSRQKNFNDYFGD